MPRLIVHGFTISLDGYGAGPEQSLEAPMGTGGQGLHPWLLRTQYFQRTHMGHPDGDVGVDNDMAVQSMENLGAWIMGRNMFGPVRGPWPDEDWKGWWGPEPPYHVPVFVLTHHARPSVQMEGGTVFHFVTEGIEVALERAREAAGSRDIRLGGGASTIRQYLQAKLVDEMHIAVSPILLGAGEPLLAGIDLPQLGYTCAKSVTGERAVHYSITRA
ncbi:MAG TPA: dihydrofolate reductase family protein [Flavobacteriales bacterium]|nr:dihydrofolate reductase family protein [Flavobacteriales bacterium]